MRSSHDALRFQSAFPLGTAFVNMAGTFLIGVLSALLLAKTPDSRPAAFFIAGFLGGFTTFSSFVNEAFQLLQTGSAAAGIACLILQPAAGAFLGKWLFP